MSEPPTKTIRDWTTEAGLRAAILLVNDGSHHCGYVAIPEEHPFHGLSPYTQDLDLLQIADPNDWSSDCLPDPASLVQVHGGLTYGARLASTDVPGGDKTWWMGFDCAHLSIDEIRGKSPYRAYDSVVWRDEAYVAEECEKLARQLVAIHRRPNRYVTTPEVDPNPKHSHLVIRDHGSEGQPVVARVPALERNGTCGTVKAWKEADRIARLCIRGLLLTK